MINKMQQHILSKEFKLRDYNKTFNKYESYKKNKVFNFFKDNKDTINFHLEDLKGFILSELDLKINNMEYLGIFKKPLNKTMINSLMTIINSITYDINIRFIGETNNLNKNEIKNFIIILYLKNYKKINKIMKNTLIDFLEDYDKKIIVENL